MIGYMIEQELGNLLPFEVPFATLLTMVEVDGDDPGFKDPTKFVGPVYDEPEADRDQGRKGLDVQTWTARNGAASCHRRCRSAFSRSRPIRWLLDQGTIVICAGGGGIPTMYEPGADRKLVGVEAVIDKDLCSELLARELNADLFVMATDADAVFVGWGNADAEGDPHGQSAGHWRTTSFRRARWVRRSRLPAASPKHRTQGRDRRACRHSSHRARREGTIVARTLKV